jgi:isoquinoline 1-oxidoreductase alpha subunit
MVMAAAALIDRNDSPTDQQIDAAITNICRCGIYPRLREAIRLAIRIKNGRAQVEGAPPPHVSPEDAARANPALRAEPRRRQQR